MTGCAAESEQGDGARRLGATHVAAERRERSAAGPQERRRPTRGAALRQRQRAGGLAAGPRPAGQLPPAGDRHVAGAARGGRHVPRSVKVLLWVGGGGGLNLGFKSPTHFET